MISVGRTNVATENARPKTEFWRFTCGVMLDQLKYASVTPTVVAPPTTRLRIQMVEMIARRTRSVKMVKWVRGRTITVHLTTDTAARCQIEHTPNVYMPLLIGNQGSFRPPQHRVTGLQEEPKKKKEEKKKEEKREGKGQEEEEE